MSETKKKTYLRYAEWFGTNDKNGFMYRSWMKNQGMPDHEFQGKPVIGIFNTWSELTPATRASASWPITSRRASWKPAAIRSNSGLFERRIGLRPTAMLTRNLASIDVEESIRPRGRTGARQRTG